MQKMNQKKQPDTLEEIRKAIMKVDDARCEEGLACEERIALEKSALLLRDMERSLIRKEQKELSRSLAACEQELKGLSREIRERVHDLNRVPKVLDKMQKVLVEVLDVLKLAEKFLN